MSAAGENRDSITAPPAEAPSLVANARANANVEIVPASRWRQWMDEAEFRWPNRCLPLLMANESGWWLLNPESFSATWDGGNSQACVSIEYDRQMPERERLATSHFGFGIITFAVPYIFTTDPGWELLARGPANLPKDGLTALEGLVETDWATASFTMNWKITRPNIPVRFEAAEPFCMIVPQRRHDLESITPQIAKLEENEKLAASFHAWLRHRDEIKVRQFVSQFGKLEGVEPDAWQKDYFKGRTVTGDTAPEHRTKRSLQPFAPRPRTDDVVLSEVGRFGSLGTLRLELNAARRRSVSPFE